MRMRRIISDMVHRTNTVHLIIPNGKNNCLFCFIKYLTYTSYFLMVNYKLKLVKV